MIVAIVLATTIILIVCALSFIYGTIVGMEEVEPIRFDWGRAFDSGYEYAKREALDPETEKFIRKSEYDGLNNILKLYFKGYKNESGETVEYTKEILSDNIIVYRNKNNEPIALEIKDPYDEANNVFGYDE